MTDTLLNCTMIFNHYDINCVLNSDSKKVDKLGNYRIFHSWFEIPKELLLLKKIDKPVHKKVSMYPWVFLRSQKIVALWSCKKTLKNKPAKLYILNGDNICVCGASF